ncbi:hypothetical protein A2U01_0114405, partial [Trifolium medium]|nr:hypothetical protein [Trifolium medium]
PAHTTVPPAHATIPPAHRPIARRGTGAGPATKTA